MKAEPKIDVVWKVGTGSTINDWELRMSMRSVHKFLKDCGKLWVIGHIPKWLDTTHPKVRALPWPDPYKANKDANLILKLIYAGLQPKLTEKFVFMSDDYVILQSLQYEDMGPFWLDDCARRKDADWEKLAQTDSWQKRLYRTYKACRNAKLPTYNWEIHAPMPYLKSKTLELMKWDFGAGAGYTIQSLYYNANKIEGTKIPTDYRAFINRAEAHPEEAVRMVMEHKTLTFNPKGVKCWYIVRLLGRLLPKKAPWEIGDEPEDKTSRHEDVIRKRLDALKLILGEDNGDPEHID